MSLYPATDPDRRPALAWYWGWVIYANRLRYLRALAIFAAIGLVVAGSGAPEWFLAAYVAAALAALLASIGGLWFVYGPPMLGYYRALARAAGFGDSARIADLHAGTYRHSFGFADVLPGAEIVSVDAWDEDAAHAEEAVAAIRALEAVPRDAHPRVRAVRAAKGELPLETASCDGVVLGLGMHRFSAKERERLVSEARRVLRPGGALLLFEHSRDPRNLLVFGPTLFHWEPREAWPSLLRARFGELEAGRWSFTIDYFIARASPTGAA